MTREIKNAIKERDSGTSLEGKRGGGKGRAKEA